MSLDANLIESVLNGSATLFTGAGFSLSAYNILNNKLRTANGLIQELCTRCEVEPTYYTLEDVTELFIETFSETELIKFLKEEFTIKKIDTSHKIIGGLPWKRVYTTNYDSIIKLAYEDNNKIINCVTLGDSREEYLAQKLPLCIHLNGAVSNLTYATLRNEFKLTEVSYLTQDFLNSEWIHLFRNDILTSDAVVFIGFSLKYDLDLKRLFYNSEDLKRKCYFIVAPNESEQSLRQIEKFGTPIPIGLDSFAKKINAKKETFVVSNLRRPFYSFKRNNAKHAMDFPEIGGNQAFDIYVQGKISDEMINAFIKSPLEYSFLIRRSKLEKIEECFKTGKQNIIVHSHLGNGKTFFLKSLSTYLTIHDYSVFEYNGSFSGSVLSEIETICKEGNEKTVIILDNYSKHIELLDALKIHQGEVNVVLSERTIINDIANSKVEFSLGEFHTFDINKLDEAESENLIEIFDKFGFWQEKSNLSIVEKQEYLMRNCKAELQIILLDLLNSTSIKDRIKLIVTNISQKKDNKEIFIFILLSRFYSFDLNINDLGYYLGYEKLNSSSFTKNPHILEFIDFTQGDITLRSSILSQFVLHELIDSKSIIDTLLTIFNKLDKDRYHKPYFNILKELLSYTSLRRMLNESDDNSADEILRFFEGIRNSEFCKTNPHYWLQYAIEKLSRKNYEQANTFFKTAYSFAKKKRHYNTYQIDNHYARCILENVLVNGDIDSCLDHFLIAHKILLDSLYEKDDVKYYPYKVAQNYYPFYEKYYSLLDTYKKKVFVSSCDDMLRKIEKFQRENPHYKNRKDVTNSYKSLSIIVSECRD